MELTTSSSLATPRSSGGSRKHRQKFYHDQRPNRREVDAIKNPTHLFQKINSGDWQGALDALLNRPIDASVWISRQRQNDRDTDISWKYLPLHLLCLQKRPPLKLLQQLIQVYPNAASMSTPHDGNLAIHYVCESGCDSHELLSGVLVALLDANPQSLEAKNFQGKTPLLLCSAKTRQVLMGVLRMRKQSAASNKKNEHRNDVSGYSPHLREKALYFREQRHPPPFDAHLLPPLMDNVSDVYDDESDNDSEQGSTWQTETHAASNRSNHASTDPSSYSENELREQIEALTRQNKSQQQTISQLNDRLKHLTSKKEDTVAEDAKLLCQRILSKAEADSVKFRTEIQQLQAEKEQLNEGASRREKMLLQTLMNVRDVLSDKAERMKLNLFNEDTESTASQDSSSQYSGLSKQLIEALTTVFTHTETNEDKLRSQVKSLEEKAVNYDVQHKTDKSVNQNLNQEKEALIKKQRELERNISQLRNEKESVEKSLADVKEKNSSLIVMNRSLQQQNNTGDAARKHFQFDDLDLEQGDDTSQSFQLVQQTLEENKTRIDSLLKEQELLMEKNRSLKDTIFMNNEKYLNKVQELGEKYTDLEKVNSDLRKRIRESLAKDKARSSLKVSLEGDNELLYEV
jgi:hypothetical protein